MCNEIVTLYVKALCVRIVSSGNLIKTNVLQTRVLLLCILFLNAKAIVYKI